MTLNITLVSHEGVWQCSDHLLFNTETNNIECEDSIKHVSIHCSDGKVAVSYCGIGSINHQHVSDWLRKEVHGKPLSVESTLSFLTEAASSWIGPVAARHKIEHLFSIGAFRQGKPYLVLIANYAIGVVNVPPPTNRFKMYVRGIEEKKAEYAIGGRDLAITPSEYKRLLTVGRKVNRIPREHFHRFLAAINHRASRCDERHISASCLTTFMPRNGAVEMVQHGENIIRARHEKRVILSGRLRAQPSKAVPYVWCGIDLTEGQQEVYDAMRALRGRRTEKVSEKGPGSN